MAHALLSRLTSAIPVGGLVLALAVVARAAPDATRDEGDDQYRFLVGLIDKGMYERAIGEADSAKVVAHAV